MAGMDPDDFSRFNDFNITTVAYKIVDEYTVSADILIPKNLLNGIASTKLHPVILRYHGGGFITGSSSFPPFFSRAILELATKHNAIIVSPDYRLVPEVDLREQCNDIKDFWTWTQNELSTQVENLSKGTFGVDLSRIMITGDSAGGYHAIMAALDHPDAVRTTAVAYPMIDLRGPYFWDDYEKHPFGLDDHPPSLLDDLLDKFKASGEMVSADGQMARFGAMFAAIQHGLYRHYVPDETAYFPLKRVESGDRFPRGGLFVWHGNDDTVVPVDGSKKLAAVLGQHDPDLKFRLSIQDGEHGFDADTVLSDPWMAEIIAGVEKAWLE